ncbi:unnamed protein product, partial [marine sediment metagenome]
ALEWMEAPYAPRLKPWPMTNSSPARRGLEYLSPSGSAYAALAARPRGRLESHPR